MAKERMMTMTNDEIYKMILDDKRETIRETKRIVRLAHQSLEWSKETVIEVDARLIRLTEEYRSMMKRGNKP